MLNGIPAACTHCVCTLNIGLARAIYIAGNSPNLWSYTVNIYGSCQTYLHTLLVYAVALLLKCAFVYKSESGLKDGHSSSKRDTLLYKLIL